MNEIQPTEKDTADSDRTEAEVPSELIAVIGQTARRWLLVSFLGVGVLGFMLSTIQPFLLHTFVLVLIFALFALGFDFAFGFLGMHSFGHAAMFGVGGYTTGLLLDRVTQSAPVVFLAAILAGMIIALLIAILGTRTRDIYFAMISLAFAQIIHILAFQDIPAAILGLETLTGGDNGLFGIPSPTILSFDIGNSTFSYFLFTLITIAASTWLIVRLANSRFGRVLRAIQQNENRALHLGYNVNYYKSIGFTISGGLSALAGALFVSFQGIAHPNSLFHWLISGEVIIMTLLGGMGTLWGPMLGAGLFVFIEETFTWFPNQRMLLALIFVLTVIFLPEGLASLVGIVKEKTSEFKGYIMRRLP